jgi:four helix bundle protein
MQDFRNLNVWQSSHQLTLKIYSITRLFPKEEMYALTSQIRRASSSIGINIAEGCGRGSDADFGRFLQMSLGSASEVEYLLLLSHDLNYIKEEIDPLMAEVQSIKRMLSSLLQKTKSR